MRDKSFAIQLADRFLESIRAGEHGGLPAEEIVDSVTSEPDFVWAVAEAAVAAARSDFELDCVGAFILETLMDEHADEFVGRVIDRINSDDAFLRAAATLRMTGQPDRIWRRINSALRSRGVPEDWLVDWSTIKAVPEEDC